MLRFALIAAAFLLTISARLASLPCRIIGRFVAGIGLLSLLALMLIDAEFKLYLAAGGLALVGYAIAYAPTMAAETATGLIRWAYRPPRRPFQPARDGQIASGSDPQARPRFRLDLPR